MCNLSWVQVKRQKMKDEIFPIFFINDQTMLSASKCFVCALVMFFWLLSFKEPNMHRHAVGASRELTALKAACEKGKKVRCITLVSPQTIYTPTVSSRAALLFDSATVAVCIREYEISLPAAVCDSWSMEAISCVGVNVQPVNVIKDCLGQRLGEFN